jgi:hypothetical protein
MLRIGAARVLLATPVQGVSSGDSPRDQTDFFACRYIDPTITSGFASERFTW